VKKQQLWNPAVRPKAKAVAARRQRQP